MRTAFLTVVYPKCAPYLRDLIASLNAQTDRAFELCIANDGLIDLHDHLRELNKDIPVRTLPLQGSPTEIRIAAISWLKTEDYDFVIFGDADDAFSANRVLACKQGLSKNSIVFHDQLVFQGELSSSSKSMLSDRYSSKSEYGLEEIREFNFLGLSNTGIRLDIVQPKHLNIPKEILAFDWVFFSKLLLDGHKAHFLPGVDTYYRQHPESFARLSSLNHQQILNQLKVKATHYNALSTSGDWFKQQSILFSKLLVQVSRTESELKKYAEFVHQQNISSPLWWESIQLPRYPELNN